MGCLADTGCRHCAFQKDGRIDANVIASLPWLRQSIAQANGVGVPSWECPPCVLEYYSDPHPAPIRISFTLEGTVESFDSRAFQVRMADMLGVDPESIGITVAAASVSVQAVVIPPSAAAADLLTSTLAQWHSPQLLSQTLNVTILSIIPAEVMPALAPLRLSNGMLSGGQAVRISAASGGTAATAVVLALLLGLAAGVGCLFRWRSMHRPVAKALVRYLEEPGNGGQSRPLALQNFSGCSQDMRYCASDAKVDMELSVAPRGANVSKQPMVKAAREAEMCSAI